MITRSMIRERRIAWANFMLLPTTKKAQNQMVSPLDHEAQCCLAHGCGVAGLPRDGLAYEGEANYPPDTMLEHYGLWDRYGAGYDQAYIEINPGRQPSLAVWNDDTPVTPQEIGAYLLTVVEGGDNTPFRPLERWPEA